MSEHYEPSYYEIALTGRQVLAAFVILLVCLVAAFFSGVWVGRGGEGGGEGDATEVVADAPEDGGAEAEPPAPDEDLEELSFFEGDRGTASGGGSEQDAGSETAGAGTPAGDGAQTGPSEAPERDGEAQGRDGGPAADDPGPAEVPAPAPSAEPTPSNEEDSPSPSLATGDIVVQVFSSSEEDKARDVLERLQENEFRAFLSPVANGERTLYRVRVGPFEHMDEARAVANRLRERLGLETWITQ